MGPRIALALATICLLAGGTADAQANQPPVVELRLAFPPVYPSEEQNHLDLTRVYDPDGWIETMRITVDGVLEDDGPRQVWRRIHFSRLGLHTVTVEVVDNQGARVAKTLTVYVRRPEPVLGPRFSLFVAPHLPTADVIREGLPVSVMCKHTCAAAVELQITRYRARKLGLRPPRRGKLTVAADVGFYPNWEHHFLLRPNRRVRRAFRRARRLPVLLKVTSFRVSPGSRTRTRTTQAEIELTGPRRRRR